MFTRADSSISMNMTPLIDVVFLLIIFFLVSSHLAQQETQLELDLPDAASGDPEEANPIARRVTLNLLADGALMLAGEVTPVERLQERLAHEKQQAESPLEVRLRADRSATYGQVEPVLVACAKAGVWNLRFAVHQEGQ